MSACFGGGPTTDHQPTERRSPRRPSARLRPVSSGSSMMRRRRERRCESSPPRGNRWVPLAPDRSFSVSCSNDDAAIGFSFEEVTQRTDDGAQPTRALIHLSARRCFGSGPPSLVSRSWRCVSGPSPQSNSSKMRAHDSRLLGVFDHALLGRAAVNWPSRSRSLLNTFCSQ